MTTTYRTPSYIFVNDEDNLELAHLPLNGYDAIPGIPVLPELTVSPLLLFNFTRTNPVQGEMIWDGVWG